MNETVYDMEAARREEETYRTPAAIERRCFVRENLNPDEESVVLSLGPGPGFEPAELASIEPVQSVIGVDQSKPMLALAAERCAANDTVSLLEGEATALPLPTASVDAAVSVQVYGYIDALGDALTELHRVLRPGGSAVVYATDWNTLVWRTGDSELAETVYNAWKTHCTRPRLGSELSAPLRKAGFQIENIEPYTICNTNLNGTFAGSLMPEVHDHTADMLDEETADAWTEAIEDQERGGETFFSLTGFLHRVIKPTGIQR